jgi:hypothetical protein
LVNGAINRHAPHAGLPTHVVRPEQCSHDLDVGLVVSHDFPPPSLEGGNRNYYQLDVMLRDEFSSTIVVNAPLLCSTDS